MLKKMRGFTLIELLVVIAIIGILATIVIINVSSSRAKAKDSRIKTDLSEIRKQAAVLAVNTPDATFDAGMINLRNDIVSNGGIDPCLSGGSNYCQTVTKFAACSSLNIDSNKYVCVTSASGELTETTTPSDIQTSAFISSGGGGMTAENDALVISTYNNGLVANIVTECDQNIQADSTTSTMGPIQAGWKICPSATTVWPSIPSGYAAQLTNGDLLSWGITISLSSGNTRVCNSGGCIEQ